MQLIANQLGEVDDAVDGMERNRKNLRNFQIHYGSYLEQIATAKSYQSESEHIIDLVGGLLVTCAQSVQDKVAEG